ncbi:hypothetical protein A2U01_0079793, partial [Trifolium medium]|nr:hypothetical protein [Trifolium medium]
VATQQQKVWPLPATTGELWRPRRPHLTWRPQDPHLATQDPRLATTCRARCSVAV